MLQSCHIPYLGSHSSCTEVALGVAPLKVYKNASSNVDFVAYSPLFTLHMLLYSICIPADPSEMCLSEFCCFALGLTASPSGQTACCFFSPMKINAMNNAIRSILAGTLTNKSAWYFFFPELVYEADFSAVFPLWILPSSIFIAGACARSSPNHLCLFASITVMFRANKQFYRA